MPTYTSVLRHALFSRMFNGTLVENRWRGDLVEEMVRAVIEPDGWRHCSADWKSWDFEHSDWRLKIQVKQTARRQTWGVSPVTNRYGIAPAKGFYEGAVWRRLPFPQRLAEAYILAHHPREDDGADHWDAAQWLFYVIAESDLPNAKSISIDYVTRKFVAVGIEKLSVEVQRTCSSLSPNNRTEQVAASERSIADDADPEGQPG